MDKLIFLELYNLSKKNRSIKYINDSIVKLSSKFFFTIYVFFCVILVFEGNSKVINFLLSPLFLLITNICLRKIFKRIRPYEKMNLHTSNIKKSFSFPSNHAACSSVIATVCFFINPYFGIILIICSFITGISRIISGLHYPSDIFVGWLVGFLFGFIGFTL